MKNGMDNDKPEGPPIAGTPYKASRDAGLYCGADSWKYYGPGDSDPAHPGQLISDLKSECHTIRTATHQLTPAQIRHM